MKTSYAAALLAASLLAALGWSAAQPPQPTPAGVVPPGPSSLSGSIGFTVYNNVIYLIREGAAVKVDASTIPSGHMMTLDGRIEPLPPGIRLPDATAPETTEPAPRPGRP
jgi:hypothetical protein